MGDALPERNSSGSCSIFGGFFRRKNKLSRRSASTGSVQSSNPNNLSRNPSTHNSEGGSIEDAPDLPRRDGLSQKDRIIARPGQNHVKSSLAYRQHKQTAPVYKQNSQTVRGAQPARGYVQGKKLPYGSTGISGELESLFEDHQTSRGPGKMVRVSSSNVMLHGNLGNLRQPGATATQEKSSDYQSRNAKDGQQSTPSTNGKYSKTTTCGMGNVVKRQNNEPAKPASLCRALSTRMDPEQLKILGNEDYKNGNFEEALALYDAAISIDPNKAAYRSNKSAALTALGRLLDAVLECREAIRIDPFYQRAHHRLATLNLRLGDPEKAMYHFKHAGAEAEPEVLQKARNVQVHLNKCSEAKRQCNWNTLLKECDLTISAGADSAPQIFALKAEAFLRLKKHEDADVTMRHGPNFDVDDCTKYFGPIGNATLLVIQAQVNMVIGRFDDAVTTAQLAARLDSNNKEVKMVFRKTTAVAMARSKGNELFKTERYSEACIAYGEGLNHGPHNSILLCNRAACRSKLGQYEEALNDCNAALSLRPNFTKARLRRADCCLKMQIWETCLQDCEVLLKENPNNEEARIMLNEAQAQMKRRERRESQGTRISNSVNRDNNDNASDVVVVSNNKSFEDYTKSHEISVVLFSNKQDDNSITLFLEQLSIRYPSVKFLKVEVEDCPELEESEGVDSLPSFKLYKNGSRTKEISGNDHDLLESTIKFYTH